MNFKDRFFFKNARLSEKEIKKRVGYDVEVRVFNTIDSTNNEAKRLLENGYSGKGLIIAETQTSGRGRLGRSFYSPEGTGLYFTVVLPPDFDFEEITLLTPAAAVAVTRVIDRLTDKKVQIKWVNDIYLEDKKICGILAEAVTNFKTGNLSGVAIGIGINICTSDFPMEISFVASSLGLENADRNFIAASIANELFAFAKNISAHEFMPEYQARSYVTGKDIFVIKGEEKYEARALGIDNDGGLIIELADGTQTILRGGEISVRLNPSHEQLQ